VTAFFSPSYRAAASDLTVAVSPLGLVELADEEFEVHGPRLNRYASNWAWYLGHHWAYRREMGDAQLTFNYVKALADYKINFTFGSQIHFGSPEATAAITPFTLKRAWDEDNDRKSVIWEIGQLGAVSGDVFVKIAYEPPYEDPTGMEVPGRIRILPLNPAHCFPEFHPHDRTRFTRFKVKYKFWGTGADGTRQIHTYTELLTDESIEEYINDELIDSRPNPLGQIPIAFTPNMPVASSPWGLSDIQDIVGLNREFNEKATEVSDIINYHAAPVTVVTGAKAANLEKGPKKVWTIGNKDARVQNLTMESNLSGPMGYMEMLKTAMHEITGVPMSALGQMQPISNTSGTALQMSYFPLMQQHKLKQIQYSKLFKRINELVIRTAILHEPDASLQYIPEIAAVNLRPGQYQLLDPRDPATYRSTVEWGSPLPMDNLIKLNEVQGLMTMGLESKRGALKEMGNTFPDQKLQEVYEELLEDQKQQGGMSLTQAQINQFILAATGFTADGQPVVVPGTEQTDAEGNPVGMAPAINPEIANEVMLRAFGLTAPARDDFTES
jgi:hypothetical protein